MIYDRCPEPDNFTKELNKIKRISNFNNLLCKSQRIEEHQLFQSDYFRSPDRRIDGLFKFETKS